MESDNETSEAESYSSAGSSFAPGTPRRVSSHLRELRRTVEKRKAKVALNTKEKQEKKERQYPELIPTAKGDLGTIEEEEEDQAMAE